MSKAVLAALFLTMPTLFVVAQPQESSAHHYHHSHNGYLYPPVEHYELNSRTATAQSIPVRLVIYSAVWAGALQTAKNNWNAAVSPISGFNPYVDYASGPDFIRVDAGNDVGICGLLNNNPNTPAHACVAEWNPTVPTARVYMYLGPVGGPPVFNDHTHRVSDLMHELGHVLYNAGEHYNLPGYGCSGTPSIMNHCLTTAVTSDDLSDYRAAYGMTEAPDATYVQMLGAATTVHYFEGSYLGGDGRTQHAEQNNWIDRSTGGIGGSYTNYFGGPRKIANADDGIPENDAFASVPSAGAEWCFKRRGRAGGLATNQPNYWGPLSRAYCLARSGSGAGVFIASNRNDYVGFRVWNFTGATIENVVITLDDANKTRLCELGNIAHNGSPVCFAWLGNGSGYVNLYYNFTWTPQDTIGYDSQ